MRVLLFYLLCNVVLGAAAVGMLVVLNSFGLLHNGSVGGAIGIVLGCVVVLLSIWISAEKGPL